MIQAAARTQWHGKTTPRTPQRGSPGGVPPFHTIQSLVSRGSAAAPVVSPAHTGAGRQYGGVIRWEPFFWIISAWGVLFLLCLVIVFGGSATVQERAGGTEWNRLLQYPNLRSYSLCGSHSMISAMTWSPSLAMEYISRQLLWKLYFQRLSMPYAARYGLGIRRFGKSHRMQHSGERGSAGLLPQMKPGKETWF